MRRSVEKAWARSTVCRDQYNGSLVFASAAAMLFSTTLVIPTFAVLPVFASVSLAGAAFVVVAARLPAFKGSRQMLCDLAGACVLIGAAAAILSRPTQIVQTVALLGR